MRLTTIYQYHHIVRLFNQGRREPKGVAQIMHVSVDIVYRALKSAGVSRETSSEPRRKNRFQFAKHFRLAQ